MLNGLPGIDPARRAKLMEVLDINPNWRMHTVSDGQRRRVQICLGLLKPFDVLLLDEITVDLDVLGRADLMQFLREECEQRGATIIYVRCHNLFCCLSTRFCGRALCTSLCLLTWFEPHFVGWLASWQGSNTSHKNGQRSQRYPSSASAKHMIPVALSFSILVQVMHR